MNISIVSLCDENRRQISDITAPTVENFSKQTGVRFIRHTTLIDPSLHAHWNKFLAVRNEFVNSDWVMWLDADIAIVNPNYNLVGLIESFGDKDFLVSTDYNGLCAGAFLLRNCEWSLKFIDTLFFLREIRPDLVKNMNQGFDRPNSDQDPIKILVSHWPSVKNRTGCISEDIILSRITHWNANAFAIHYWATSGDMEKIYDCVERIKRGEWSKQCTIGNY